MDSQCLFYLIYYYFYFRILITRFPFLVEEHMEGGAEIGGRGGAVLGGSRMGGGRGGVCEIGGAYRGHSGTNRCGGGGSYNHQSPRLVSIKQPKAAEGTGEAAVSCLIESHTGRSVITTSPHSTSTPAISIRTTLKIYVAHSDKVNVNFNYVSRS